MTSINAKRVAHHMCTITHEHMWIPRIQWAKRRIPTVSLKIRAGTGKATYLAHPVIQGSSKSKRPFECTLTYGVKMIESKCKSNEALGWLSAREIVSRNYYQGEVSLLNLLSHTIIHEFGHFIQCLMGERTDNSVHNDAFYAILDRAHSRGHGEKVRQALHELCLKDGIDLSSINFEKELQARSECLQMQDIIPGQLFNVKHPEYKNYNPYRVEKKNRTTVRIVSTKKGFESLAFKAKPSALAKYEC